MRRRKCYGTNFGCVNVAGREGLGAACTPHEVTRMSFTIIEALGIRRIREIVNRVVKGFVRGFVFLFHVQCTNEALSD